MYTFNDKKAKKEEPSGAVVNSEVRKAEQTTLLIGGLLPV